MNDTLSVKIFHSKTLTYIKLYRSFSLEILNVVQRCIMAGHLFQKYLFDI